MDINLASIAGNLHPRKHGNRARARSAAPVSSRYGRGRLLVPAMAVLLAVVGL